MKLDQWLASVYAEETEKLASVELEHTFDNKTLEEVLKIATGEEEPKSIEERAEAAAKRKAKKRDDGEKEKTSSAKVPDQEKLAFADALGRQLARTDFEVAKQAMPMIGGDDATGAGMESTGDFTSPEAQAKAKVMSGAMKATKGAPTKVRKGAMRVAGKRLAQASRGGDGN